MLRLIFIFRVIFIRNKNGYQTLKIISWICVQVKPVISRPIRYIVDSYLLHFTWL